MTTIELEDQITLLSPVTVKDIIKGRGTRIATVTFLKTDGKERVANGLFRPSSHIVGSERGFKQSQHMKDIGLTPFYDLKKGGWICFYIDRVVNIK